ncbi:MAG: winged helix-turn-helix domain-containing protein [Candidatus Eremiobacteraeota bacterium]|nr:winged helix-turn-helix domain-containing protein [Candidatus Eremiobacteraeota bacterium]
MGSLQLDMRSGRCTKSGRTIRLSARETALLEYLLLRKGRTVPRGELMQHVWHREDAKKSTSLNVYVRLLRMKVENDPHEPRLILTVPRVGYRLDPRGA